MTSRFLLAIVVTAAVGLTACGKSEEPAPEQKAPETGAVEEGTTMIEQAAAVAKDGAEKASEMTSAAMEEGAEVAGAAVKKAEELIQKAKGYIDNNQVDLAEGVMGSTLR